MSYTCDKCKKVVGQVMLDRLNRLWLCIKCMYEKEDLYKMQRGKGNK
jgi:hypothetical protein